MKLFRQSFTCAAFCAVLVFIGSLPIAAQKVKGAKSKSKSAAPRTVTDFYLLLPAKYFPFFDRAKNRRDLIESEQIENGYLDFVGNRPAMPLDNEMLLLKRPGDVPMLVIAYTDCFASDCEAVLRFVEYADGRWTEVEAAPKFDLAAMREVFRSKTGKTAAENPRVFYSLSPTDKSLTVNFSNEGGDVEIYRLEWNDIVYDFAAPPK